MTLSLARGYPSAKKKDWNGFQSCQCCSFPDPDQVKECCKDYLANKCTRSNCRFPHFQKVKDWEQKTGKRAQDLLPTRVIPKRDSDVYGCLDSGGTKNKKMSPPMRAEEVQHLLEMSTILPDAMATTHPSKQDFDMTINEQKRNGRNCWFHSLPAMKLRLGFKIQKWIDFELPRIFDAIEPSDTTKIYKACEKEALLILVDVMSVPTPREPQRIDRLNNLAKVYILSKLESMIRFVEGRRRERTISSTAKCPDTSHVKYLDKQSRRIKFTLDQMTTGLCEEYIGHVHQYMEFLYSRTIRYLSTSGSIVKYSIG